MNTPRLIYRTVRNIADGLVPEKYRNDFLFWLASDKDAGEKDDALRAVWDSQPEAESKVRFSWRKIAAIAAALIIPVAAGVGVLSHRPDVVNEEARPSIISVSVPDGSIRSVLLSDGTLVTLNAGSSISYPESFGSERRVTLRGEATFKVTHSALHPFIVSTDNLEIQVLGTYFNVTDYMNEDASVTLVDGSLSLSSQQNPSAGVTLTPGNKGTLRPDGGLSVTAADVEKELAWIGGNMIFKGEKLSNIIAELERHYGIKVTCDPDVNLSQIYTVSIMNNESFESVIGLLTRTSGGELLWSAEGNKVFVKTNHINR